mmetsp:Transcript_26611/g.78694  ORF Transcript_26611/g.78694 Transcript_26611/m.78694 type:complete len:224 (-) Transcript_26611:112-783(-)
MVWLYSSTLSFRVECLSAARAFISRVNFRVALCSPRTISPGALRARACSRGVRPDLSSTNTAVGCAATSLLMTPRHRATSSGLSSPSASPRPSSEQATHSGVIPVESLIPHAARCSPIRTSKTSLEAPWAAAMWRGVVRAQSVSPGRSGHASARVRTRSGGGSREHRTCRTFRSTKSRRSESDRAADSPEGVDRYRRSSGQRDDLTRVWTVAFRGGGADSSPS